MEIFIFSVELLSRSTEILNEKVTDVWKCFSKSKGSSMVVFHLSPPPSSSADTDIVTEKSTN